MDNPNKMGFWSFIGWCFLAGVFGAIVKAILMHL